MKTNQSITLLRLGIGLCLIVFFNACKKKHAGDPYEITGHLYRGCPKKGIPDATVTLRWSTYGFLTAGEKGIIASTTTDNNGYFKLTGDHYSDIISLDYENQLLIENLKPQNLYDLEYYLSPVTILKINLNVIYPYTATDTLFIEASDSLGHQLKVEGPFTSGLIYTVSNYKPGNFILLNYTDSKPSIGYRLNKNSNRIENDINLSLCDTSTVTFTIN